MTLPLERSSSSLTTSAVEMPTNHQPGSVTPQRPIGTAGNVHLENGEQIYTTQDDVEQSWGMHLGIRFSVCRVLLYM